MCTYRCISCGVCVCACVRACVHVCVHACVCVCSPYVYKCVFGMSVDSMHIVCNLTDTLK